MGVYLAGLLVIVGALKVIDTLFCKEEKVAEKKESNTAVVYKN